MSGQRFWALVRALVRALVGRVGWLKEWPKQRLRPKRVPSAASRQMGKLFNYRSLRGYRKTQGFHKQRVKPV